LQEAAAHPDALPHLCRVLRFANVGRIAIVGGAALSPAERIAVQRADTVLCFDGIDMRRVLWLGPGTLSSFLLLAFMLFDCSAMHRAFGITDQGARMITTP
jgi:hypothetical protein